MSALRKLTTLTDPITCDDELRRDREGWVVVHVRPNMSGRDQVLWQDLITALGHTSTLSTRSRTANDAQTQAFCWMGSAGIDNLAVGSANFLTPRHLSDLCAMASALGMYVWLLYDIEPCDERSEALDRLSPNQSDVAAFLQIRMQAADRRRYERKQFMPPVPDAHFFAFLESAEATMNSRDFDKAKNLFFSGRSQMLSRLQNNPPTDEDAVASVLHEITADTNDINEVTCIVKGAQAAAFMTGWNMQVDIPRWVQRGTVTGLRMQLDDHEWKALGRLQHPCAAAACALSVLGISSNEMPRLGVSAIGEQAATIEHLGVSISVPEIARPLLLAQLLYRDLIGSITSPFLVQGPKESEVTTKWAGRLMHTATRETGVVLRARAASRKSANETRWTLRRGISVKGFTS